MIDVPEALFTPPAGELGDNLSGSRAGRAGPIELDIEREGVGCGQHEIRYDTTRDGIL